MTPTTARRAGSPRPFASTPRSPGRSGPAGASARTKRRQRPQAARPLDGSSRCRPALAVKTPQNDSSLPPCDMVQRGGQALGQFAVDVGGGVSDVGLATASAGFVTAGASVAIANPAGVLVGGALVADGGTATGVGGLITAGGATLMALSGSGKEAVKELATRVLTRRIPSNYVKDVVGKGVGFVLDILPEIRTCGR